MCKQMYVHIHTFVYVCACTYIKRVLELNSTKSRRTVRRYYRSTAYRGVSQVLHRSRLVCRARVRPEERRPPPTYVHVRTDSSARASVTYKSIHRDSPTASKKTAPP